MNFTTKKNKYNFFIITFLLMLFINVPLNSENVSYSDIWEYQDNEYIRYSYNDVFSEIGVTFDMNNHSTRVLLDKTINNIFSDEIFGFSSSGNEYFVSNRYNNSTRKEFVLVYNDIYSTLEYRFDNRFRFTETFDFTKLKYVLITLYDNDDSTHKIEFNLIDSSNITNQQEFNDTVFNSLEFYVPREEISDSTISYDYDLNSLERKIYKINGFNVDFLNNEFYNFFLPEFTEISHTNINLDTPIKYNIFENDDGVIDINTSLDNLITKSKVNSIDDIVFDDIQVSNKYNMFCFRVLDTNNFNLVSEKFIYYNGFSTSKYGRKYSLFDIENLKVPESIKIDIENYLITNDLSNADFSMGFMSLTNKYVSLLDNIDYSFFNFENFTPIYLDNFKYDETFTDEEVNNSNDDTNSSSFYDNEFVETDADISLYEYIDINNYNIDYIYNFDLPKHFVNTSMIPSSFNIDFKKDEFLIDNNLTNEEFNFLEKKIFIHTQTSGYGMNFNIDSNNKIDVTELINSLKRNTFIGKKIIIEIALKKADGSFYYLGTPAFVDFSNTTIEVDPDDNTNEYTELSFLEKIATSLNPYSEHFFLRVAIIPNNNYFQNKFSEIKNQFMRIFNLENLFSDLKKITQVSENDANDSGFQITLPDKYGGDTVPFFNMNIFNNNKHIVFGYMRAFLWIGFLISLFRRIPDIISGNKGGDSKWY